MPHQQQVPAVENGVAPVHDVAGEEHVLHAPFPKGVTAWVDVAGQRHRRIGRQVLLKTDHVVAVCHQVARYELVIGIVASIPVVQQRELEFGRRLTRRGGGVGHHGNEAVPAGINQLELDRLQVEVGAGLRGCRLGREVQGGAGSYWPVRRGTPASLIGTSCKGSLH